jgi:hypothetical protein
MKSRLHSFEPYNLSKNGDDDKNSDNFIARLKLPEELTDALKIGEVVLWPIWEFYNRDLLLEYPEFADDMFYGDPVQVVYNIEYSCNEDGNLVKCIDFTGVTDLQDMALNRVKEN